MSYDTWKAGLLDKDPEEQPCDNCGEQPQRHEVVEWGKTKRLCDKCHDEYCEELEEAI